MKDDNEATSSGEPDSDATQADESQAGATQADGAQADGSPFGDLGPPDLVSVREFNTERAIELDISNNVGPITVELAETAFTHVEVRHAPASGVFDWRGGLTGLLSWVSEQFGDSTGKTGTNERAGTDRDKGRGSREPVAEAIQDTRIDLAGNRLAVRTPSTAPLRAVPLALTIAAPEDSQVNIRTGSGKVAVAGRAGRVQIQSGAGDVSVDRVTGNAMVRTGSGQLRLGEMRAGVQARSGSGDVEIASIGAPSSVVTGSGDVWLGQLRGDVLVRSGSGDLSLTDALRGQAELITGSGELQVSVHDGVAAEVDLTSSTGTTESTLAVTSEPPATEPELRVYGRTGSGDALITSAI